MEKEMVEGKKILSPRNSGKGVRQVTVYDFRRPDKFSREQLSTLEIIHETFARLAARGLSERLGLTVRMDVDRVDQMTFQEFIQDLPPQCPMGNLRLEPLRGFLIMEMDPSFASAGVDRLFGGTGEPDSFAGKDSPLQRTLWEGLLKSLSLWMGEAWCSLMPVTSHWGQLETNPQFVRILPPGEMVVIIRLKTMVGGSEGGINICLPFLSLEPILGKLSSRYWFSRVRKDRSGCLDRSVCNILRTPGEIVYPAESLSLRELGELGEGSLVKLDFPGEAFLRMGGEPVVRLRRQRGKELRFLPLAPAERLPLPGEGEREDKSVIEALEKLDSRLAGMQRDLEGRIGKLEERLDAREDRELLSPGDGSISTTSPDPFGFISSAHISGLYSVLSDEHSQIISFVLSRMDPAWAAALLDRFEAPRQTDFIRRICRIERVAPELVRLAADSLSALCSRPEENRSPDPEGIMRVVGILNRSPRSLEKHVILSLEETDAPLTEEIKKRMFVFEDIILLEGKSVRRFYERADRKELALAMKTVAEERVLNHIYGQLSEQESGELKEVIGALGRVRISDVDRAQQNMVELIRVLEGEGEILIARTEELGRE